MSRRYWWLLAIASATGCSTGVRRETPVDPFEQEILTLARETRVRVDRVTRASSLLRPAPVAASTSAPEVWPPPFDKRIYLDWHGEVSPVVETIGRHLGWKVRTTGIAEVPTLVIVRGEQTIGEALEAIGTQSGGRLKVLVDLDASTLEVVQ